MTVSSMSARAEGQMVKTGSTLTDFKVIPLLGKKMKRISKP
jgi:hypothetical protein